jgi:hypothetical protein
MIEAPIFHVNGDDPEAVVHVARARARVPPEFRARRGHRHGLLPPHGHNEGDEPAFTQPLMYQKIISLDDSENLRDGLQERSSGSSPQGPKLTVAEPPTSTPSAALDAGSTTPTPSTPGATGRSAT